MAWNTAGNIRGPKGEKGDPGNAADIAALIHAATSKTPVDADELPLLDSAGSWALRKFTWATLKTALQSLFFYRGNILGTVSQAGGVPTGAIIQRGSNANGEFVRFADGTQICTISTTASLSAATNAVQAAYTWTYPASFSSVQWGSWKTRNFGGEELLTWLRLSSNSSGVFSLKNTGGAIGSLYDVTAVAIGRWF